MIIHLECVASVNVLVSGRRIGSVGSMSLRVDLTYHGDIVKDAPVVMISSVPIVKIVTHPTIASVKIVSFFYGA